MHLPLDTCSVTIRRRKQRAFIALGSNMGDKKANLEQAIDKLRTRGIHILKESSVLATEPWGGVEQDSFANQVIEVETWLPAPVLLETLLVIESEMGRVREVHWGPRLIDLDLLFVEDQVIYTDELILPHPYIAERLFVLEPLVEIAPHFIHPILKQPIRYLVDQLEQGKCLSFPRPIASEEYRGGTTCYCLGLLLIRFGQVIPRMGYQLLMGYFSLSAVWHLLTRWFQDKKTSGKISL